MAHVDMAPIPPQAQRGFTRETLEVLVAARDEPEWLRALRREAWHVLQDTPLPATTDEPWRRTDIKTLPLNEFDALCLPPSAEAAFEGIPGDWKRAIKSNEIAGSLVMSDGTVAQHRLADDARASGVIFTDMVSAVREHGELVEPHLLTQAVRLNENYFAALHGAFWQGGTFLYVPRGVEVALPLRSFTWLGQGNANTSHTLVVMERGSRAVLIDEYGSKRGQAINIGAIELFLQDSAQLDYVGIQDWGREVWSFTNERALVQRDATLHWVTGGLGSRLTKTFLDAQLIGQGATALLSGVFFADGTQHLDIDTEQNHVASNAKSDLLYKGALKGSARTVWQGMIRVNAGAQKTDSYQANRNMLLSDQARADSIPGLEINADDVRCTHGSTVSRLDEEEIFYLMSRGIGRLESEVLLVNAFFTPVLDRIPLSSVRERLKKEIAKKMKA